MFDPSHPRYAAHDGFVARAGSQVLAGQLLTGLGLIALTFYVLVPEALYFASLFAPDRDRFLDGATPVSLLVQLLVMVLPIWALRVYLRRVEKRTLGSVFGPIDGVVSGLRAVAVPVALVLIALELLPPWIPSNMIAETRFLPSWLLVLPVALVAIAVQVTAEEAVFRGFLQQRLAILSPSPLIWMVLPSVGFGLLHYLNAESAVEGAIWVLFATLIGMACADLTARHGSLGPAIALHFINNVFALVIWGVQGGPMSGLALFLLPDERPSPDQMGLDQLLQPWAMAEIVAVTLFIGCLWLAARLGLRR